MKWNRLYKEKDCFVAKNAPRNDSQCSVIASPERAKQSGLLRLPCSGQALRLCSGQATLELTAALILVAILIVGAIKIFVWLNARIVTQQAAYDSSRVAAGKVEQRVLNILDYRDTEGVQVDDSAYPQLNLFR